jgi:hypothetical protein
MLSKRVRSPSRKAEQNQLGRILRTHKYLERPPAPWQAAPEVELGPAELEQLRALGYALEE